MMKLPNDYNAFQETLANQAPPDTWPKALQSLWYDAKGNWHTAHDLIDGSNDSTAKWIHAYLHRKEGDEWNAGYWYRQAGKSFPKMTLDEEAKQLVLEILS
ncbi:hypothetical protein [Allomuricauda sp. d1]|uniref:hypothetical protein n=1 Tax=Allomuricauda sp. d1 TaxID=3136725 RepID=UPI0031DFD9B3